MKVKYLAAIFLLIGSLAHAQTYPTNTVVTSQNVNEMYTRLIAEVYGECGCRPSGAAAVTGTSSFNGWTYETLTSGARFFDTNSDRLLIFHAGHDQSALDTAAGGPLIQYALSEGWDILALDMPPSPHVQYANDPHPLINFVNPVTLSLNYVLQNRTYNSITMSGLSGGGWTTVLYAAIDERITKSVPVAGSWPKYLRYMPGNAGSIGDYEQTLPGMATSYFDLYALSLTNNREQVQVFNSGDPCCFPGNGALDYLDEMETAATDLGGTFSIIIANNNQHTVHDSVFSEIAGGGGVTPPPPPPSTTVAHWTLDDINTTVVDDVLGPYDGTYFNSPILGVAPLTGTGTAVTFDGSADYVTVPDNANLRPGVGEYSIEMWAAYTGSSYGMAFGKFDLSIPYAGPTIFFNLANSAASPGRIELRDKYESGYLVDTTSTGLNDGIARYYVFQRRNVNGVWYLEIYIDGVLDASTTLPSVTDLNTTQQIYLFSRPSASQSIGGTFDNVIYHVGESLTPAEILIRYNQ